MSDLIGQRLGNYDILALLGRGGMATVYRARQVTIRRDVAIKVIKSDLAETADFVRRFEREAETIASLNHPHILKLFDYGQFEDTVYLVMELQPGGTLADLIRQRPLDLASATRVLDQLAAALDYAHKKGIIHRDLKPQNILLDESGNAHLSDFGIAKLLSETTALTQSGVMMGTPAYMAPEQWQGQSIDARADIYALGVILFEMVSGQLPFKGDTPYSMMHMHINTPPPSVRALRLDLTVGIEGVIVKALAKDPAQRFGSAGQMAEAFRIASAQAVLPPDDRTTVIEAVGPVTAEVQKYQQPPPPKPGTSSSVRSGSRQLLPVVIIAVGVLMLVGVIATLQRQTEANTPSAATFASSQVAAFPTATASMAVHPTVQPAGMTVTPALDQVPKTQTLLALTSVVPPIETVIENPDTQTVRTSEPLLSAPTNVPVLVASAGGTASKAGGVDIASLNDEFEDARTLSNWSLSSEREGYPNQAKTLNINGTSTGNLYIVPYACTWFGDYRGVYLYKEVTGDFIVTTRIKATGVHSDVPTLAFSLAGLLIRAPRESTVNPWQPGRENWLLIGTGYGNGTVGEPEIETKLTVNSRSDVAATPGTTGWVNLRVARIGPAFYLMSQLGDQAWTVQQRFVQTAMPQTVQVGIHAYTNWNVMPLNIAEYNTRLLRNQPADLVVQVDYVRFLRPQIPSDIQEALTLGREVDNASVLTYLSVMSAR